MKSFGQEIRAAKCREGHTNNGQTIAMRISNRVVMTKVANTVRLIVVRMSPLLELVRTIVNTQIAIAGNAI